ncbi:MAG: hypothetical protein PHH84_01915 [Oscillospiraceae bacterium]|nr:hypothetical protein [Oscillospiraceae bacterium]MDD4413448.1 hypothetical protein [Oscillospiraceae bacterium]
MTTVLVLTGNGEKTLRDEERYLAGYSIDYIAEDLQKGVEWLIGKRL